jgi:hypothetical protein
MWACIGSSASAAPPLRGHLWVVGHGIDVLEPTYEADPRDRVDALAVRVWPRELDEFLGASSTG